MRLEKIKLAGFKSFVDPTTVPFPSNLVGVVGPNGCGKSNVIDAVRWVMGESSAKMLRGESMADVIFNGSNTRKPVGMASIELIFDNADGSAGGQYAQYAQISVRRQVTRDGQSFYSLNGVRCRRRDITDLFLGTGLGPRSYAIIEQGMISRIIESRPEELRVYLEEAAGISKYKERRRETESRIRATRENLERLNDLRDEVEKQLRHLERQAATAERYKLLKAEEREVGAELLSLRLSGLESDLEVRERQVAALENQLQAGIAEQRRIEAEIEHNRDAHHQANDGFNDIQGRYYALGAEIARLEEGIQYAKESRRQNQGHLQRAQTELEAARAHSMQDQDRLEQMATNLMSEQPELDLAKAKASEAEELQKLSEASMAEWQSGWDAFNQSATLPAQEAQVERARINHLEQQEGTLKRRLERLAEERERLSDLQLQAEINELEQVEQSRQQEVRELAEALAEAQFTIGSQREQIEQASQQLAAYRSEFETLKGRLASLHALQQAALGKDDPGQTTWLTDNHLASARPVLDMLEVDAEWQRAVEIVLGTHLQALCVDDLSGLDAAITEFKGANLGLIETSGNAKGADGLAAKVSGPSAVLALLAGVQVASSQEQAFALRGQLQPGQSVITPDGLWLGQHWLRWMREQDASSGVLARSQEIRQLEARQAELEPMLEQLAAQLSSAQAMLAEAESAREQHQRALDQANKSLAECVASLTGKRARAEHIRQRAQALQDEIEELREQVLLGSTQMEEARSKLHRALEQMETLGAQREQWVARRERLQNELRDARQQAQAEASKAHQIALRVESLRSSERSLRAGLERTASQLQMLTSRCEELQAVLAASDEPIETQQTEMEERLQQRMGVENELSAARKLLEEIDHRLRELDRARHQSEQQVQQGRDKLNAERLLRQEVLVRINTLEEQLAQTGLSRAEVQAKLAPEANVSQWQERVSQLGQQIARLGPINLAAIDEFKEQTERMTYLDAQLADVTESLTTLEEAIAKIDRETRTRFKDTFDMVNAGLKAMFPKLFGGGHAYLEMVGEDLLDAGVAIMARPPGKRNSSIHLLSGGEKALSAVALVFSIFQLNPAPFCMLDEVDAPLDDANVSRFCELVKEMSRTVQFIFITHNKVTMEIANQLIGVTMHEPGCSRPVSVDIEEAAQMAAM